MDICNNYPHDYDITIGILTMSKITDNTFVIGKRYHEILSNPTPFLSVLKIMGFVYRPLQGLCVRILDTLRPQAHSAVLYINTSDVELALGPIQSMH